MSGQVELSSPDLSLIIVCSYLNKFLDLWDDRVYTPLLHDMCLLFQEDLNLSGSHAVNDQVMLSIAEGCKKLRFV